MIGPTSMDVVHSPRAGTTTWKVARSGLSLVGAWDSDLDPAGNPAPPIAVHDGRRVAGAVFDDRGGQLAGLRHGAGPALLDGEEVGEVGADAHLDRAGRRLVGEVAHGDVLEHPPPDRPGAEDDERRVGPAGRGQATGHERGRERIVAHCRQRLGERPVDQDLETADEPGVLEEEALGTTGDDVAARPADGEGRLVDQGHRCPCRQGT